MTASVDRTTVLREVGIAHGMLRGLQYTDATTTAQYQATGTQYIAGQSFRPGAAWPAAKLTKYNIQKAGTGVYFVTGASHNSVAVEFRNYLAVIESPVGDNRGVPMSTQSDTSSRTRKSGT